MKARERILTVVCLALVFFAVHPLTSGPLAVSAETESVSPLGSELGSNTFYGFEAGNSIPAGGTQWDTFIGWRAGYSNTTGGAFNTFIGNSAGYDNTTGDYNTFIGYSAGANNTTASSNTFVGHSAGETNTIGEHNTFVGYLAGSDNTTGSDNSFFGWGAGINNTTGYSNTFIGRWAGIGNTEGFENAFLGHQAGNSTSTGDHNTFLGADAGYSNTTAGGNSFVGYQAGYANTGFFNSFLGYRAGSNHTTGSYNTFLGYMAGNSNATGSGNVFIGYMAGIDETGSEKLYIGQSSLGNLPLIYGEFTNKKLTINGNLEVIGPDNGLVRLSDNTANNTTKVSRMVLKHYSNAALPLYLFGAASTAAANFVAFGGGNTIGNAATQLDFFTAPNTTTPVGTARLTIIGNGYVGIGTNTPSAPLQMAGGAYTNGTGWFNASSREYKEEIEVLSSKEAMEAFEELKPVKFAYRTNKTEKHVGFVAEEVPELVATKDRKGLSPMDIVAVLTKVVQELKAENEALKTDISSLVQRLNALEGKGMPPK